MKIKQLLYHFIIALIVMPLYAQDLEKDTIRLKEVKITNRKPTIVSFKFRRGLCTGHEFLDRDTELASMGYDFPKGRIKTLRFNFNNPFEKGDDQYYKDTQLELNFYNVDSDGKPGDHIAGKTVMVPADHRGRMTIDVYDLAVYNENGIYIALRRASESQGNNRNEFEVDCSCYENTAYKVARRRGEGGDWYFIPSAPVTTGAFDLTVTVEQ